MHDFRGLSTSYPRVRLVYMRVEPLPVPASHSGCQHQVVVVSFPPVLVGIMGGLRVYPPCIVTAMGLKPSTMKWSTTAAPTPVLSTRRATRLFLKG